MKRFKYRLIPVIIYTIINIITMISIHEINLLPNLYLIFIFSTLIGINVLFFYLIAKERKINKRSNKKKIPIFSYIFITLFTIIQLFGIYNLRKTNDFLGDIGTQDYVTYIYQLYEKNDDFNNITDLADKKIASTTSSVESYLPAIEYLTNQITFEHIQSDTNYETLDKIATDQADAILFEKSQYNLIKENNPAEVENLRLIQEFEILVKTTDTILNTNIDITSEPVVIYLTGIDTYGDITTSSLSDVNMLAVLNPKTKQIQLISIPRDYYVEMPDISPIKDKLTHATIYGVDNSIRTISNLLNVEINHYVKINFTTLVKLVDSVGPIEINSKYEFCSYTYCYNQGINYLNGAQTLEFSRERYNLPNGDLDRAANQQLVINSLIQEFLSPDVLLKYPTILNSLTNSFETTITTEDIEALVKMQLSDFSSWSIGNFVISGTSSMEYTYSYPNQELSVLLQDPVSIAAAKILINNVLEGKENNNNITVG